MTTTSTRTAPALVLEGARWLGGAGYLFNLSRWLEYLRPFADLPDHEWYREIDPLADALEAVDPGGMGPERADLGYCALGDPESCVGVMRRFEDLGVDQVLMLMQTAALPDAKVRESIRLFGEEVIPACRGK